MYKILCIDNEYGIYSEFKEIIKGETVIKLKESEFTGNIYIPYIVINTEEIIGKRVVVSLIKKTDYKYVVENNLFKKYLFKLWFDKHKFFSLVTKLPVGQYKHDTIISQEELNKIMNPYPAIILQLVNIMEKYGDKWIDETKEQHLDSFNVYDAATEIHKALTTQQLDLVTQQLIPYEQ